MLKQDLWITCTCNSESVVNITSKRIDRVIKTLIDMEIHSCSTCKAKQKLYGCQTTSNDGTV